MSMAAFLYPILSAAAEVASGAAVKEFAKGAGKTAYDALVARLKGEHGAKSLDLLPDVAEKPGYEAVIQADLEAESIAGDPRIRELAEQLAAAMAALPESARPAAAIDVNEIRARGNQLFKNIDGGIRADRIEADGDQTFEGITRGK